MFVGRDMIIFIEIWRTSEPCHTRIDGNEALLIQEANKKELRIISLVSQDLRMIYLYPALYFIVNCHISGNGTFSWPIHR